MEEAMLTLLLLCIPFRFTILPPHTLHQWYNTLGRWRKRWY